MNIRAICSVTSTAAAARSSSIEAKDGHTILNAEVPLAEMFGYATAIRSLSKGRASYSMEPFTFEQVPNSVADHDFGFGENQTGRAHLTLNNQLKLFFYMAGQRIRIRLKAMTIGSLTNPPTTSWTPSNAPAPGWQARFRCRPASNASPFCARRTADKKSQETFEQRTHKRLLDIIEPTAKTVDELKKLNLPAGVDITIKI